LKTVRRSRKPLHVVKACRGFESLPLAPGIAHSLERNVEGEFIQEANTGMPGQAYYAVHHAMRAVVFTAATLCTFADKPRAMAEIRRVLRPTGRLALSDVVVDRPGLPPELDGALATVACVGEALSREGDEDLIRRRRAAPKWGRAM
jgi:SAM-dependent methyltransferase